MKKYINHGRSKMQGMYLKFPIFLITFDIIKEKELHQSIARFKTAKGRVKKMERMMWNIIKAFNIVILKNLSRKPNMKIGGVGLYSVLNDNKYDFEIVPFKTFCEKQNNNVFVELKCLFIKSMKRV